MAEASHTSVGPGLRQPGLAFAAVGAVVLHVGALAGVLSAAWGYALFVLSSLLLLAGTSVFAGFILTRLGQASSLQRAFVFLLSAGATAYVFSVAALAGYYIRETWLGRMEWHWIVFGPLVLGALILLDYGLYRKLVQNNLPTWRRYSKYIARDQSDPAAMRRTLMDDVVLQRSLFRTSKIRWTRHALIFWGFLVMFMTEIVAVVFRDGFPAFGWPDWWREPGSPLRLAFAWVYDVTGLMILAGCVLALGWRVAVNSKPERKFSDTPTTLFLLFVVVTGFVVEGLRIAPSLSHPWYSATPIGIVMARLVEGSGFAGLYRPLWLVHVIAACVFIAYVPARRLIHSCATPLGRLANSQKTLLAAKKRGVLRGMLRDPVCHLTPDSAEAATTFNGALLQSGREIGANADRD